MYTATKREIIKFIRAMDLSSPRSLNRIICLLRNEHRQYWFNEDKVVNALEKMKAHSLTVQGVEPKTYYYIKDDIL